MRFQRTLASLAPLKRGPLCRILADNTIKSHQQVGA
jgi:hypothetical protein